jgi:hypothetical protein
MAAGEIEDGDGSSAFHRHLVGVREAPARLGEISYAGLVDDEFFPLVRGRDAGRMQGGKFPQAAVLDDAHVLMRGLLSPFCQHGQVVNFFFPPSLSPSPFPSSSTQKNRLRFRRRFWCW